MKEYLDAQAAKTAIPTPAQAEAGNYRKGRVKAHGLPIVIETARGSMRRGIGHDGKPWAVRSPAHYGYISRTEGADGDHVDVYIGPHLKSKKVYVLDQRHADTGRFDEHKVFLGFASARQVLAMYRRAFSDGKADARFGKLMEMSPEQFRDWLAKADTTKPIHRADGGRVNYADGGDIADGMFGTARDYMLETGAERPELFDPYAQETAAYLRENNGTWGQRARKAASDFGGYLWDAGKNIAGVPVKIAADPSSVAPFVGRLTGTMGYEREQTWPEKMIRSGATLPGDVYAGREQMWDPETNHTSDRIIERTQDLAGLAGGSSFAAPAEEASLRSGASRRAAPRANEPTPTFYSAVGHAVDNISQPRMTGEAWLGTLKNRAGVKPEEMEWTGLQSFLESKKGEPVTKQEIADHLATNQVELKEVRRGEFDPSGDDGLSTVRPTKYGDYQLSGGENYREMLLTMPVKSGAEGNAVAAFAKQMREKYGERWVSRATPEESARYDALIDAQERAPHQPEAQNYKSPHWDEPNVLAHVRMNDRTVDGKRSLHLEEIQSDWHQKGKNIGYKQKEEPTDTTGWSVEDVENSPYKNELRPGERHVDVRNARGEKVFSFAPFLSDDQSAIAMAAGKLSRQASNPDGVPDAPFKKTWHELALKRMLREAAENGYDRLSWTPGEAQAARYDLSKQVDKIAVPTVAEGSRSVRIDGKNGDSFKLMVDNGGKVQGHYSAAQFDGKQLSDVVGKEMADKIMKLDAPHEFSGEGLRVGGEGMKGFYDQIVPKALEKIAKEHGVKVKKGKLRAPTLEENPHSAEKYSIKERGDQFVATFGKKEAEFKTWDEAAAWLKDQRSPTVWYIDIPQSLKDQAMKKGFPLFSEGAAGAGLAADRNSRDERRSGGAVEHMADGGAPSADGWVDVPDEKSSDWVDVPGTESKPKSEFAWSRAVTDIPSEIGKEAMTNLSAINRGFNPWAEGRGKPGTLAGFFDTGRGIVSLPALAASPITGTARAVLGRTMGNIEHKIGEYIAPDVAAKQDPEKVYEDASGDVDKAMMAMAAGRRAPRAAVNVPPPDTIGDFNVPLTRGEAAGDFNSRVIEQRALRGGMGNPAQRVAQDFMDLRNQRLEEVRGGIGREFDQFGQNVADSPSAGADLAAQAIRTEADRAKRGAQNLYDEAFARPGEFDPEAFRGIGNGIRQRLSAGTDPVIVDERLTPVAARALQDIDENIGHLRIRNDADPMGAPNPADIVGVNLRGVDQARKRLVSLAKGAQAYPPTPDTRAMQAIIGAFDGEIENAIQAGLFRGDPEVIDLLRNARGAWSDYRKTFFPQFGGDDVGRAVQKIIGRAPGYEATPTEVANYLYGATSVGAKGSSVRLAQRVRSILGENSPEWSAVRQGVWDRMTTPTEARLDWGPQKQSERIYEFLNGSGRPFAEAVFTPDERTLMRRYADLLRRMVPPPGAVNYSNNVPMLNKIVDHADHVVGATIGAKIGGIHGAAIGYGAGKGTSFLRNMANARQVAKLMPTLERSMRDWQRAQAVANRAGLPSSPATAAASANLARVAAQLGMDYSAVLSGLTGAVKAGADEEKKKP